MDILLIKQEAVKRMNLLGLSAKIIQSFREHRKIYIWNDETMKLLALNTFEQKIVSNFERKHRCVVYYAMCTSTNFGELISFLFVTPYENEWNIERRDLKENRTIAYVYNTETPEFSEIGYIEFKPSADGNLRRTG